VLLSPDFTLVGMNDAYLGVTMRTREELVGRNMFDAFPRSPDDPDEQGTGLLRTSLERVVREGVRDHLALVRYAIPRPDGSFEERYWSATHTPLLDEDGGVRFVLQHTVDVTELHRLRMAAAASAGRPRFDSQAELDVLRRARAVQETNRRLESERQHLRRLFEQAPGFIAILDEPDHVFAMANAAYRSLVGGRDVVGLSVREALPELEGQGFYELLDRVFETGEPYVGRGVRALLLRDSDGAPEERFLDFVYQPITDEHGAVTGIFLEGHDITEERRARERQALLINELNHRVKNTLATVQSIASNSMRTAGSLAAARAAFESRLMALSRAHDVLTRENWEGASLGEIARDAVEPYRGGDDRILIRGPEVRLSPRAALALAMGLQELSTNAVKYGALSNEAGRVEISWALDRGAAEPRLRLRWQERDGPPVAAPSRRGFGSRLIERSLSHDLDGRARIHFAPDGVVCEVDASLVA
jgi:PAS domain S-box-containing protein